MSRQSRHFPVTPEVRLVPDERGSRYLLSVTATDRLGLLYSIARVLTQHYLNVHTAKVLTLGERAEDIFLVSGAELGQERNQLEIEQDLLLRTRALGGGQSSGCSAISGNSTSVKPKR